MKAKSSKEIFKLKQVLRVSWWIGCNVIRVWVLSVVQLTPLAVRVVLVSSVKSKTAECDWSEFFLNRKEGKKNLNLNTTVVKLKKWFWNEIEFFRGNLEHKECTGAKGDPPARVLLDFLLDPRVKGYRPINDLCCGTRIWEKKGMPQWPKTEFRRALSAPQRAVSHQKGTGL